MKFLRLLALAATFLLGSPARAEQGTIVGPIVGPHTATDLMSTINASLLAIQSCNSGSSAPANGVGSAATHYQCWADTTTNPVVVKMYDGTSWATVGKLNTSSHAWTPSYQGTDLGTASTATTGTSGHTVPFLDGTVTVSGLWSFNSGDLAAVSPAFTGTPVAPTAVVDTNTTQLATTAYVVGQAASATPQIDGSAAVGTSTRFARGDHVHPTDTTRAAVASPTLTGTPAAPTAAVDTNTTQLATTAYVIGQAASAPPLIDGSAAAGTSTRFARGDHVHPTDTTRAAVASPTLTGTPAAPTAAVDTNTTQLATTAYVVGQAASATPLIDGSAVAGTSTRFARGDHVHPTDTSRAPTASPALTGTVDIQQALTLSGDISPTQLAANTNDWAPTGFSTASTVRLSTDASRNVTGLAGGADGRIIILHNVGSFNAILTNEDALSTAANRFLFGGDMTLATNTSVTLRYDATSSRWRAITSPGSGGGGGGTVTSAAIAAGGGISVSGTCTITTSGTCTVAQRAPTVQVLTSGTGATYTTAAGVAYLRVKGCAAGGGGGGSGTGTSGGNGGNGGTTSFSASTMSATGGVGSNATSGASAAPGAGTNGQINYTGHGGTGTFTAVTSNFIPRVPGGASPLFGGAAGAGGASGMIAGAGSNGGSGGAGGCFERIIASPSATYTYTIGTGGAGGTAGTSGSVGIAGTDGQIVVEEF